MARTLRISGSVFFGTVVIVMLMLWVRSHSWRDNLIVEIEPISIWFSSEQGECALFVSRAHFSESGIVANPWKLASDYVRRRDFFPFDHRSSHWWGFDLHWHDFGYWGVFAPHWFLVGFAAATAAFSWRPQSLRFSLRTMLFSMTLLVGVFGLGVWLAS
jgi:hypothetical protein